MSWIIAVGVVYAVLATVASRLAQDTAGDVLASLLERFGDRLAALPVGWYVAADRAGKAADVATRGLVFVASTAYMIVRPMITAFVTPATVLVSMVFIDWRIAAVLALSAIPVVLTYRMISARLSTSVRAHSDTVTETSERIVEYSRHQPALRAVGDATIARGLIGEALGRQHAATRRAHLGAGGATALFAGAVHVCVVAIMVAGTWKLLDGAVAVATFIGLLVLTVRFTDPIIHSGALGGGLSAASDTLDHLEELNDHPTLPEPRHPATPDDHTVRFDDVVFSYGGPTVLNGVSFTAPKHTTTAIVGPSGAGKSTIVRLLTRFYDPDRGAVSIGDAALPDLGSQQVAALVAPVFQDVYLFDGTITDNIRLGRPDASHAELADAAAKAHVDRIVARLPDGWNTRVGEGGALLSGGERQRIAIARALLKDAPIVVLDEATAALDAENEEGVSRSIEALGRERTLIVIAHRLQTIRSADNIVVLDGRGGVADQGTHEELHARNDTYRRYWQSRRSAAGWRLTDTTTNRSKPS